jgi:translocation and assembly module TamB
MTLRRILIWSVAALTAVLLILAATAYWASRSETVLRWGIERIATALPCSLTVQGLQGSLSKPVRVQIFVCENNDYRIEARDIALVWLPWQLANRHVHVTSLSIAALNITFKPSAGEKGPSPQAPSDLRLPVAIDIASLEIDTLVAQRDLNTVQLGAISAAYSADRDSHRLQLGNLDSEWGRVAGEASIGASAPLPLTAKLTMTSDRIEGWPVSAETELSGELRSLSATVQARTGALQVAGKIELTPFEAEPVKLITARVSNIDAAAFDPRAPQTAVVATVQAQPIGMSALIGRLQADNSIPGRLDEQRMPLRSLAASFDLDATSLRLSELKLDLGAAGTATGAANFMQDRVALALDVTNLDLQAARADLRETRLNGSVKVEQRGDRQLVAVDLREKDMQLEGNAEVTAQRVVIERMAARAGGAQLRASATVERNEQLSFSLDGTLIRFDPSRFGEFPQADINGKLQLNGKVRPEWSADVAYQLSRSRFTGVPLGGQGKFRLSPARLTAADLQFDFGGNHFKLSGNFGERGDVMAFALDAERLDRFEKTLSGKVQASGTLRGTVKSPEIKGELAGQQLAFDDVRVGELRAQIEATRADDPVIRVQANLRKAERGEVSIDVVDVSVEGTLKRHTIAVAVAAPGLQLVSAAEGGWDASARVWSGNLVQLENKGDYAFRMTRQARLELARGRVAVGATGVEFSQTRINLGETRYQDGALQTQGDISGVRAARLLALIEKPPPIESTLVLGARWDIRAGDTADGVVELFRIDGDIVIPGEEPLSLDIKELRVTLRAAASRLTAEALLRSAQINAQGTAQTRLEKRGVKWGVPGTAPLNLTGEMNMQSIRPLAALASREVTADGELTLAVNGSGTIAESRLRGNIEGDKIKIEHVANGVFFEDGILRASFTDDALTLTEFRLKAGQGELTARGRFSTRKGAPLMNLDWSANKLAVIQHPELRLTVSGAGQLGYQDATVSLKGELAADQGRVELHRRTFPSLGDDVVVAGREERSQLSAETKRANLDLLLDLGPDFTIVGRGLDARLAGQIRLTSSTDKPLSADGEIRVASGTFEAYGRRLQIEEGVVYFAGPVNNPGLSIRAMRKNQPVEAGVEVSGTARDPRVRLVSNPEVSDPDKLAWLVLGRQAEYSNAQDNRALQSSATALAAGLGTTPFQQQLASAVGLDEISFIPGTGQTQGGVVAVGKQLSDRIYVTQEIGTSAAQNTLRVSYQLTRRWSVRTESGETDAVDLFFTFSFD